MSLFCSKLPVFTSITSLLPVTLFMLSISTFLSIFQNSFYYFFLFLFVSNYSFCYNIPSLFSLLSFYSSNPTLYFLPLFRLSLLSCFFFFSLHHFHPFFQLTHSLLPIFFFLLPSFYLFYLLPLFYLLHFFLYFIFEFLHLYSNFLFYTIT